MVAILLGSFGCFYTVPATCSRQPTFIHPVLSHLRLHLALMNTPKSPTISKTKLLIQIYPNGPRMPPYNPAFAALQRQQDYQMVGLDVPTTCLIKWESLASIIIYIYTQVFSSQFIYVWYKTLWGLFKRGPHTDTMHEISGNPIAAWLPFDKTMHRADAVSETPRSPRSSLPLLAIVFQTDIGSHVRIQPLRTASFEITSSHHTNGFASSCTWCLRVFFVVPPQCTLSKIVKLFAEKVRSGLW